VGELSAPLRLGEIAGTPVVFLHPKSVTGWANESYLPLVHYDFATIGESSNNAVVK
jgi:hypothetical protein